MLNHQIFMKSNAPPFHAPLASHTTGRTHLGATPVGSSFSTAYVNMATKTKNKPTGNFF